MEENKHITIATYSCLYGKEEKSVLRQRHNKTMFERIGSTDPLSSQQPLDSIQFMEEVCAICLPEVGFLSYQKHSDDLEYDYEVQIIIDTHLINEIESCSMTMDSDDLNLERFQTQHRELNELLLPYKRGIVIDGDESNEVPTDLRTRCVLIPIKLTNNWSLIWVKFTKFHKLIEMTQISSLLNGSDEISYKSQQFIKWTIADLLSIEDHEALIYKFEYRKMNQPNQIDDITTVQTLQKILKGYQDFGFNTDIKQLPDLAEAELEGDSKSTRTRNLPVQELDDIREINTLYTKRRSRVVLPTPPPTRETKKRPAEVKTRDINNSDSSSTRPIPATKKAKVGSEVKAKRGRKPKDEVIMKVSPLRINVPAGAEKKIYVTLDNLNTIRETLDYDKDKMEQLIKLYTTTYDHVEATLLDKWCKAKEFSKNVPPDFEPPFLIYGPSQIEFEILKSDGIIATNSLKQKILKYDVVLGTKTMRSLTSSRRWINQRFKFDPDLKEVFYTRDVNLIIPDYHDIPYIVIATHAHYGHISADETFEVTHKNWYISRKMVQFIVSRCCICQTEAT